MDEQKSINLYNSTKILMNTINLTKDSQQYVDQSMIDINLTIEVNRINRTLIFYSIKTRNANGQEQIENCSITLVTLPPKRLINVIYTKSIPYIMIFVSIQMGILLDLNVLNEIVRRPISVTIGFICQYGFMPMIAFAISKIFQYPTLYGFSLFAVGCCPGGTASNQLTVIFDGDLNLSAVMTFVSTVASFFMMPLWFYTLGNYAYLQHLKIRIPFSDLIQSLATIVGPLTLGLIIAYFLPKVKQYVMYFVKPIFITLFFYFFGFGTYVNFYLFTYIDWRMALTAPLLPWFGYILAGIFAWIFRQDWPRVKTIAIETGIQNIGIAFLVLLYTLPEPENNQTLAIPIVISFVALLPFYAILIINTIRKRCFNRTIVDDEESKEMSEFQ